jgi:Spy/CpxP family protein refolding chaperone
MLAVLSVASGMLAQTTTPPQAGIDSDIALLRSDVQAQKTDVIAHTMQFTDAQGQAFWPLSREYAGKQQTIGDQRVSIIKDYADSYDTLDDAKADELAALMIKFDDARTQLRAEFYPKFKKAIGAKQAAKFLQVDNRLTLLVDLEIASAVPIIQ